MVAYAARVNDTTTDPTDEAAFYAGLPATRGAAGALLLNRTRQVLLVDRAYNPNQPWGLPGGIIEPGESPLRACQRELREELAVDPVIDRLAVVDWVPARPPRTAANMWLFTGHIPPDQLPHLQPNPAELRGCAWVDPAR